MRIHVHSHPSDPAGSFTQAQWDAAFGVSAHVVSFGDTPEDFRAVAGEVEALLVATRALRGLLPLDAPRLRMLSCSSAGLDSLAPFNWLPEGVALLNNSGAHGPKASEYVLMALLMMANRMAEIIGAQADGTWLKMRATTLAGSRVTVLGLGAIGGAAAERLKAAGLRVTGVRSRAGSHPACERVVAVDDLDSVLPETDYLVVTLPHTSATERLIDRRRMELLPKGAGIVNIGRGAVIEQNALCDLLDAGALGAAVLDVFEVEPVPAGDRLWTTRNLIVTPHMSSDDPATYNARTVAIFAENVAAFEAGRPLPNRFDPATGTRG